ncbi:MAG: nucleotidyltransferase domain-containing protein, partial [Deltaproteobacteria bacterium]|nr:nucleotidyltransferase domain-containing protein [Deltaproteobacteria bacterium]
MVNQSVINNLKSYLDLLRKNGFPVSNLILYGSQAKGTASDESDIDILVISPLFDQNPR